MDLEKLENFLKAAYPDHLHNKFIMYDERYQDDLEEEQDRLN